MNIILDIAIVLIIAISFFAGLKRGLVKSLINFFGATISAILASVVATPVSKFIFTMFIEESLYEKILAQAQDVTGTEFVATVYQPLPEFIKALLEQQGVTESSIESGAYGTAETIATTTVEALAPVLIIFIKFFVVIILFLLFIIVIKALGALIEPILKLPLLNEANKILGGVFGVLFGVVIVWVCTALISFSSYFFGTEMQASYYALVEASTLFKFLANFNPLDWIIM